MAAPGGVLPDSLCVKVTRAAPTTAAGSQALGYSRGICNRKLELQCLPGFCSFPWVPFTWIPEGKNAPSCAPETYVLVCVCFPPH